MALALDGAPLYWRQSLSPKDDIEATSGALRSLRGLGANPGCPPILTPAPSSFPDSGQVNVYRVVMEGWTKVHFDAYGETINSTNGKKSFWKSPFSHDGTVPVEEKTFTDVKVIFQED